MSAQAETFEARVARSTALMNALHTAKLGFSCGDPLAVLRESYSKGQIPLGVFEEMVEALLRSGA